MYKVKLTNDLSGAPKWVPEKYKPGDTLELADNWFLTVKNSNWCEILEHYKWITSEVKTCPCCGSILKKRTKILLKNCLECKHGIVEVKNGESI